jgi:hypothetical protein
MNAKLMIGICCALVMGISPLASAHLTAASATSSAMTTDGDSYRWHHTTAATTNGVSGSYIGPSGAVVVSDLFPLTVNPVLTLCPLGYCAAANAYCDLEVLSSGAADDPLKVLDESKVDGGNGAGGNNGGMVPDGTLDDGGLGAACHTDGYAEADYNTLGCSGVSHAEDGVSGGNVWILPSCDDSSQVSDGGVATCVVNALLAGGNGLVACTDGITCIVNQTCGAGTFSACGADGTADESNLGRGGGSGNNGVNYPTDLAACDALATAATFVLAGVETSGTTVTPTAAAGGWVDYTATGGSTFAPGAGLTVDLCATPAGAVLALVPPPVGPLC